MIDQHSGFLLEGVIAGLSWVMTYFTPWSAAIVGTGSTWQGYFRVRAYTGATTLSTAANYILMYRKGRYNFNYGKNFVFEAIYSHSATSGANGKSYLKIDANNGPVDPANLAVGFRVDNNALKGIVHNGTSLTVVDLSTTLTSTPVKLLMKYTAGSKIEWFVNGVQVGESALIPSGSLSSYITLAVMNGADTADQQAIVGRIAFWEEW